MDIRLGDILVMKKAHPCGEKQWKVLRTGADFRLRCLGCGHEIMVPRFKAEKNIRSVIRPENHGKVNQSKKEDDVDGEYLLVDGYNIIFAWEELAALAEEMGAPALPQSGGQEYLQNIINGIMFS